MPEKTALAPSGRPPISHHFGIRRANFGQVHARGIDTEHARAGGDVRAVPLGVSDLRHQVKVGHADPIAEGETTGVALHMRFVRGQTALDPSTDPDALCFGIAGDGLSDDCVL